MEIDLDIRRAVSLPICVALAKSLDLSEPQCPHLQNKDKDAQLAGW